MNRSLLFYLCSLLLFSSNGIVSNYIPLDSTYIVLLRTLIGGALLLALFLLRGGRFTFYHHWRQFFFLLASGVSMGLSWMFLFEAYDRVGVSIASLLYYCGPVIVMALSPLLFHERLTAGRAVGFLSVIVGVVLVNSITSGGAGDTWGVACGLLSAATYGLLVICNKKAAPIVGFENVVLQMVTAFFTVAVFVGVTQGFAIHLPAEGVLPMAILGVVNTALGCYLYFSSIGQLRVQTVAICSYLDPLSAVLLSALVLHETLTPRQLLGAALILGGALVGELFKEHHAEE